MVVTTPAGLCSMTVRTSGSARRREPSTRISWEAGSTRIPGSRTVTPSTLTRPAVIMASLARLEATPTWAMTLARRSPPTT